MSGVETPLIESHPVPPAKPGKVAAWQKHRVVLVTWLVLSIFGLMFSSGNLFFFIANIVAIVAACLAFGGCCCKADPLGQVSAVRVLAICAWCLDIVAIVAAVVICLMAYATVATAVNAGENATEHWMSNDTGKLPANRTFDLDGTIVHVGKDSITINGTTLNGTQIEEGFETMEKAADAGITALLVLSVIFISVHAVVSCCAMKKAMVVYGKVSQ